MSKASYRWIDDASGDVIRDCPGPYPDGAWPPAERLGTLALKVGDDHVRYQLSAVDHDAREVRLVELEREPFVPEPGLGF